MKKLLALVVLMLVAGSAGAVEKPLGVEEYKSVDAVAADVVSYFPKVQGVVKSIQGGQLTITLGAKNGLVAGVTLTLWRDGKEILHPVTGAVIGRAEDKVGSVEVTDVGESTCTAVVLEKQKEPMPGDKARITPKKINLAVLPLRADHPEVIKNLTDGLNELGRFNILGSDKVAEFLKNRKERDSSLIKEMNKTFNLDVVAACGIYPSEGGKILLTVRLFYADEGRPLDTIVAMLDLRSKTEAFNEIKPFFAPASEDKSGIPDLPFEAQFFVSDDFEGRGTLQYAFSDGVRLHIFRHDTSGWNEAWAEPALDDPTGIQDINLDAADINGNGRPEIFVTVMRNGTVSSYVVEYKDGLYQRIAEVPGFLRVLASPGKVPVLLTQEYDQKKFYAGRPKVCTWSNGRYVTGAEFPLPPSVNLYGFAVAAAGETNPFIVVLDNKGRLLVYSNESLIWKSEDTYPSVGISVDKPVTSSSAVISQSVADSDTDQKFRVTGRILVMDANGDGMDEVVLPKNSGKTFLSGYTQAAFVDLGWTGTRFEQRWSIKDVGGAVLDYQIRPVEGGGARIVALVMTSGGLFAKDHVRVRSYSAK